MVDAPSHFQDEQKRLMLENAVRPLEKLRAVKVQAEQLCSLGHKIGYDQYTALLLSAAQSYDSQYKGGKKFIHKRVVYAHEVDNQDNYNDLNCNIDVDIDTLQAYATQHQFSSSSASKAPPHQPGSKLLGSQWHKLSPQAKAIWD